MMLMMLAHGGLPEGGRAGPCRKLKIQPGRRGLVRCTHSEAMLIRGDGSTADPCGFGDQNFK